MTTDEQLPIPARILVAATMLQALLVLVQATTAGSSLTGTPAALSLHELLGTTVLTTIALTQTVLAAMLQWRWRTTWRLTAATATLFGAVTIQGQLGFADQLAIHFPLGLLILLAQPALVLAVLRHRLGTSTDARRSGVLALLLVALGLTGCTSDRSVAITEGPADDPDVVVVAADNDFTITGSGRPTGPTTVDVVNDGQAPHNLVSESGDIATDLLQPGDIASFTTELDGPLQFTCTIHPGMDGTIQQAS